MSENEKVAYIRKVRMDGPDGEENPISDHWTEAEMLRELNYHEKGYAIAVWLGIPDDRYPTENFKFVDFEVPQTPMTYIKRILGNALPG